MEPSEPIVVHQRPLPETRTPTLACKWQAEVCVGGKTYVEVSRAGASHEIARTLVNAGVPDAEMHVCEAGRGGYLMVPSFHAWAEWTYSGDQRIRWDKAQASLERLKGLRE